MKRLHRRPGEVLFEHPIPRLPIPRQQGRKNPHAQWDCAGNTVRQLGQGTPGSETEKKRQAIPHDWRTNHGNFLDAFRVVQGHFQRDRSPHRMSHNRGTLDAQTLHKLINHLDVVLDGETAALLARFSEPPKIQSIRLIVPTNGLHRAEPMFPRLQPTMKQYNWTSPPNCFVMN